MKRIGCILLRMMLLPLSVSAEEENPFDPYCLTVPPAVTLEENEGTYAFVHGASRVVAMVIERVPDENPAEAVIRLMLQFDPEAVIGDDLPMAEGFVGLEAVIHVMILSADGSLLILSGHSLDGDGEQLRLLLDTLLSALTAAGVPIVLAPESSAAAE